MTSLLDKKIYISILIVLCSAFLISLPLLKPGLYQIHDDQQVSRLYLMDKALRSGQFPVRWVDTLGFGYGYPLFNFYPPFVYYFSEAFHLLGAGFVSSVKITFFFSIFLSALAMYLLAKEMFGKIPGVVASVFYLYAPYRAIDVYIRGALAESFAFVWLPLILLFYYKFAKTKKQIFLLFASLTLGLLMITHNLIFLPFMILLPVFLTGLIFLVKDKFITFVNFSTSIIFALLLSAFFWIPALAEKKFTIVNQMLLTDLANYKIHFVYLRQLWNWPWGFGGSAAGLSDGLSFKIGKLHVIVSFLAVILPAIYILLKRKITKKQLTILIVFLLFILSAFFTTYLSEPVWNKIQPLWYLQFPWRFLIFTSLFTSILAAAFLHLLRVKVLKLLFAAIFIVILLYTNIKLFKPKEYRPEFNDAAATDSNLIKWDVSQTSFEYVPAGFPLIRGPLNTNVADINKGLLPQSFLQDNANIKILSSSYSPSKIEINYSSDKAELLTFNIFNFPGWRAQVEGKMLNIVDNNKYKLISVNLLPGEHTLALSFKNTPVRSLANFISLASLILFIILSAKLWPTRIKS